MEVRKARDIRKCRYAAFKVCLVALRRDQEKGMMGFVIGLSSHLEAQHTLGAFKGEQNK
jgi:hypothetical protein